MRWLFWCRIEKDIEFFYRICVSKKVKCDGDFISDDVCIFNCFVLFCFFFFFI